MTRSHILPLNPIHSNTNFHCQNKYWELTVNSFSTTQITCCIQALILTTPSNSTKLTKVKGYVCFWAYFFFVHWLVILICVHDFQMCSLCNLWWTWGPVSCRVCSKAFAWKCSCSRITTWVGVFAWSNFMYILIFIS